MTKQRILVTGGSGQLARALAEAGGDRVRVVGRPAFDFERMETVEAVFRAEDPWLVVNAAAYTAVDAAEKDYDGAMRVNRDGPGELGRLCVEAGIPLIHVSTDYVFDGSNTEPYVETDWVWPQNVYGGSKLAGEFAVFGTGARAIILRTAWVYSSTGRNFVRTMLELAKTRDSLRVVSDQLGCPTSADDLAAAILAIADRLETTGWESRYWGLLHAANAGETSWHGLAEAVFEDAARHGAKVPATVEAISTAEYPTPAKRPPNSRLNCGRLESLFGVTMPHWRDGVRRTVDRIFAAER